MEQNEQIAKLLERIAMLEARVATLEARPQMPSLGAVPYSLPPTRIYEITSFTPLTPEWREAWQPALQGIGFTPTHLIANN